MNSNLPLELNEEELSSRSRGKRSPLQIIIWVVLIVGGTFAAYHYYDSLVSMVSQVLTLYTTPCVYLFFSKLAAHLRGLRIGNVGEGEKPAADYANYTD